MVSCETVGASRKLWITAAVAAALAGAAYFAWRHGPWRAADARAMLAELPAGDGLTVFADTRALRQSGILQRLAGEAGAESDEYRGFVAATGFEYRRDLDAFILRSEDRRRWIVAEARIDYGKLRRYFLAHGGRCVSELCSMQGSTPERQISWVRLKSGRLGMAVNPDPLAAAAFGGKAEPPPWPAPEAPLWLYLPGRMLAAPEGGPAWLALAVEGMRGARWLLWSARPEGNGLDLRLEIQCVDAEKAREMAGRWDRVLESLREAARQQGDRVSLPAILAEGTFQASGERAEGRWRIEWGRLEKLLP
ncbi:MAG: hypothetical protein ACOYX1_10105 [Acidobacteriota bacterium]